MRQKPNQGPVPEEWIGDILDLTCIGRGNSAMVFAIDDAKVIKADFGSEQSKADIETERKAFRIFEKAKDRSPHVLGCFETDNRRGLVLERCHETLRQRLRLMPKDAFPSDAEVRRWAKQAAEGLVFIHEQDIIHADVGCHNMLLTSAGELKLCDFGGSSVQGSLASTKYEVWSRPPLKEDSAPTKMSDLFALGSAIYEISTKEEPYRGTPLEKIPKLYRKGKFPSVKKIANLGPLIMGCWLQKYTGASDIVLEIDPEQPLYCGVRKGQLEDAKRWNGNTSELERLGCGVSGRVLAIDGFRVIKEPLGSPQSLKDVETEREAYCRLARNPSPYIAKCYDYDNPHGIIMERLCQTVRHRLRQLAAAEDDVLKWALQAARGLAFLHSCDIIQADVGCHNMMLDSAGNLKLCDFSGCSIDGKDASVCYEPWSQLPSADMPNKRADIFALGSAMYEMAVGHVPHHDLSEYEISRSYESRQYPADYPPNRDDRLWTTIKACWTGDHKTADEVVAHIERIVAHIDCSLKG